MSEESNCGYNLHSATRVGKLHVDSGGVGDVVTDAAALMLLLLLPA